MDSIIVEGVTSARAAVVMSDVGATYFITGAGTSDGAGVTSAENDAVAA